MEVIASDTLEFNTKHGQNLGVDVDAIFEHPEFIYSKYKVTAYPKVNVRAEASPISLDIGDRVYGEIVSIQYITTNSLGEGWGKLLNEQGYISMAWLEKIDG